MQQLSTSSVVSNPRFSFSGDKRKSFRRTIEEFDKLLAKIGIKHEVIVYPTPACIL